MNEKDIFYNSITSRIKRYSRPFKRKIVEAKFLFYYFKEKTGIVNWNTTHNLIRFSTFKFKLFLSADFKERLDNLFLTHLLNLSTFTDELIKDGWQLKFLSIWEYNIIVLFKDFYEKYLKVIRQKETNPEDFLKLEDAFLKISYRDYYPEAIIAVFKKYLVTNNIRYQENQEKIDNILKGLSSFFDSYSLTLSFQKFILAFNMVKYRKFLFWNDLFAPLKDDIVQGEFYNCKRETFDRILSYYETLAKRIEILKKEQMQTARMKEISGAENEETPSMLIAFYEKLDHAWETDKENFFLLFLLFIQGVIEKLDEFVYKEWELMKEDESIVYQRVSFDNDIPLILDKLKREYELAYARYQAMIPPAISVKVFREHKTPEDLLNSENQQALFNSFTEILSYLYEISLTMQKFSDFARDSGYNPHRYMKYMITAPEEWAGKPVYGVYSFYIELFWSLCAFSRHKAFRGVGKRLDEINRSLRVMEEELKRIDEFNVIEDTLHEVSSIGRV